MVPSQWPPGRAQDIAELLLASAEQIRHIRAMGPPLADGPHEPAGKALAAAAHTRLPMNRKERYYTGSVLPGLITENGLAHLHRFLRLCGLPEVAAQYRKGGRLMGDQDVQVFTEYSFAESVYTDEDKQRFDDRPRERDTPDVVICGPDWLVSVEAKMYHRPTRNALARQSSRQQVLVEYWTRHFGLDPARVAQVLLLPEKFAAARQPLQLPVVTWEQVRDAYDVVGDAYWYGVLREALARYEDLASPEPTFRGNADELLTGQEIVEGHADATLPYEWVGCSGGLNGKLFADDIASGHWREREYEVRVEELAGAHNWFPVAEFVARTADT